MSRPFAKYSAKPTFAQVKEPSDASDYITNKKTKYSMCSPNYCHPNKNMYSSSNYLILKRANQLAVYPCSYFDKTQLYINLYTKLDLTNVEPIITDLSGNIYPVEINTNVVPYLTYNIDPSGVLFGETVCGINNWRNYMVFTNL